MSTKADISFSKGWEFVDIIDNDIPPGAFVSPTKENITVHFGSMEVTVFALNWAHAMFLTTRMLAEQGGGSSDKCCICGANLRYAAFFEDTNHNFHVVGQECCKRVQEGVEDLQTWVVVRAMKDAKSVMTRNGERWKVDLMEPEGFDRVPYAQRPTYVSTWTPKVPAGVRFRVRAKTRVTVWAATEAELYEKVRDFRLWLKGMNMNAATRITRRPGGY